jgi:hypothetical protein
MILGVLGQCSDWMNARLSLPWHLAKLKDELKFKTFTSDSIDSRTFNVASMTDIASIVIAVISSVGTLVLGFLGFLYTRSSDERKARSEAEKLIAKYRDPLLLASNDLQSRLYGIVDLGVTNWLHGNYEEKESLRLYTAFLVGQFLSWTYILRRQVQFLRFSTDKKEKNQRLSSLLAEISDTFSTDDSRKGLSRTPFKLWRNQQAAIGELMTVSEGNELYCMGNAAFCHKIKDGISPEALQTELERGTDNKFLSRASSHKEESAPPTHDVPPHNPSQEFRNWFRPLIVGTNAIASQKLSRGENVQDQRMRRLQHLLLELMEILDLEQSGIGGENTGRCHRAVICSCIKCRGTKACPCGPKQKDRCSFEEQPRVEPQQSWRPSWLGSKESRVRVSTQHESPA